MADSPEFREMEERLIVAESAAAAHAQRLRTLERKLAVSEAHRLESEGGGRGEVEALEARVARMQDVLAHAEGSMAEMRGRLSAAEADLKENREQSMRVEAAAQVAMINARDSFDQIQQRIGVEQNSDARRLDALSAEMARLSRDVADSRGEDLGKRQIIEANIARLEGKTASDTTVAQFGDVRAKLNSTEDLVRNLSEQLAMERQQRAENESRLEHTMQRLQELGDAREQSLLRRFDHELNERMAEVNRRIVDESEGAEMRSKEIRVVADEMINELGKESRAERQKILEHQMILESAIREENELRSHADMMLNKSVDKVNHDVTALLREEKQTREAREGKLRGQISQSVLKLHAANVEVRDQLRAEVINHDRVLKAEISSRMRLFNELKADKKEQDLQLAAGRVEAARATASVKAHHGALIHAMEQRLELEVMALRKLYQRQTHLEMEIDEFRKMVVQVRTFFTRPSVSTFDRVPFQLTDELFLATPAGFHRRPRRRRGDDGRGDGERGEGGLRPRRAGVGLEAPGNARGRTRRAARRRGRGDGGARRRKGQTSRPRGEDRRVLSHTGPRTTASAW